MKRFLITLWLASALASADDVRETIKWKAPIVVSEYIPLIIYNRDDDCKWSAEWALTGPETKGCKPSYDEFKSVAGCAISTTEAIVEALYYSAWPNDPVEVSNENN